MNHHQANKKREIKVNDLLVKCEVFFAFSNEQLKEGMNKHPLSKGDKYIRVSGGGFMPKSKEKEFDDGFYAINLFIAELRTDKKFREEEILYELSNHEAFYTGDIQNTFNSLGGDYTIEEVRTIYNKNYEKYSDC